MGSYGFLSIEPKGLVIKEPYKNDSSNVWHIESDTIGQYTGMTDKNGTKIFEGDICSFVIQTVDLLIMKFCGLAENG